MSPILRRLLGILFVVAIVAIAVFALARGTSPTAGIGAAIGVVVVLIINNRARNRRAP